MRILLTNDDGIYAEGLCALYRTLREKHEVWIVAPESEKSAVGHAITLVDPLRVRKIKSGSYFYGYAVNGTPADCVKLAIHEIIGPHIDLVVSGINRGANVGINVIYSGTVSAANEGVMLGYPGLAISIDSFEDPDYCFAAYFLDYFLDIWAEYLKDQLFCLNINVPSIPPHQVKGVKFVRQSTSRLIERFERRVDPHGNVYYWQCGASFQETDSETDVVALQEGYITISPLFYDLTFKDALPLLKGLLISF